MATKIGIVLSILHLICVAALGYGIANNPDGEAVMAWMFFIAADFPVSLGMQPLGHIIYALDFNAYDELGRYSIYRDIDNFWFPAMYFGIIGTIWWYYLPKLLTKAVQWLWAK